MQDDMKLSAIYCRVACADMYALETQRISLSRLAKLLGYGNCIEYLDNGASGLTFEGPAFSQMNADIHAGIISFVLVKDIARVSRDIISFQTWINEVDKLGVTVISANGGLLSVPGYEYAANTKF